jgi:multimeric flavodoxin WrbA
MRITVLNGSPKGELSVTMQYVAYLAKLNPQHEFNIHHIAQRLKLLEKDLKAFDRVIDQIRSSDAVLWGFPLFILHVHANYKRFIELVFQRNAQEAFKGKYTAALSTSIHFFDHTAHNYIHAICDDLDMRFVDSFAPGMDDLMKEEGRQQLALFGRQFLEAIQNQVPTQRQYSPLKTSEFLYQSVLPPNPVSTHGKKVVILHDEKQEDSNLAKMVNRCRSAFSGEVKVVNIHDVEIKSSCLGCLECGSNNRCAFTGKDDYIEFYRSTVMTADVLVYAGRMVDRYLSARWKMFFDRIFFNTHTPVLVGKQIALVVSGPLSQEPNLTEVFRGFFEFQGANFVGAVSDEANFLADGTSGASSAELDRLLDQLMARAVTYTQNGYRRPQTFLGVGGMKVFRDDIYGPLRMIFPADHRAYHKNGLYKTFPQMDFSTTMRNTFGMPIVNLPPIRKNFDKMIKKQMVEPFKQVVAMAVPPPEEMKGSPL